MSRIFHRPMFRIGGSAGGITSGLRRGYAFGDSVTEEMPGDMEEGQNTGEIFETQDTAVEESTPSGNTTDTMLQTMMSDFPEPPKGSAGSDFLMNLGLNLMSGPSTGSLFGNIGEAGKEPMKQFQSQRYADKVAKYKHGMQKKQFMLDAYSKLNPDDKLKLEKEIDFWMSEAGGKKSRAEALDIVMFRKPKNPKDIEREDLIRQGEELSLELQNLRTGLGDKYTTLDDKDVMHIKKAKDFARENDIGFDLDSSIIIDRSSWGDFKGAVDDDENITLTEKNVGSFTDGYVYVDIVTGNIYEKQGPKLIKRN